MARRQQSGAIVKEIKFHANIDEHDYQTKLRHIYEFLKKGHRIKASLMFRGRENEHREIGFELFKRLMKDCAPAGISESPPKLLGNNLFLLLHAPQGVKKPEAGGQESTAGSQQSK